VLAGDKNKKMQDKKTKNGKLMAAVSMIACMLMISVYSSIPNPGHSANQVGSGTFYGGAGDVWSFPGRVGIGMDSPVGQLEVNAPDGTKLINFRKDGTEIGWFNPTGVGSEAFYMNADSDIGFLMLLRTASAERFAITGAGNVGIGTIAPAYNLHVVGDIYASGNITCGGSNCGGVGGNGSGGYWNLSGSSLYPSSISYNVGIGTTGPLDLLHLKGSTRADLKLEGGYTGGTANVGKLSFSYTPRGGDTNNLNIGLIDVYNTATDSTSGGYMAFHTRPTSGSLTERLRIDSSGNVGIGTTSPIVKLHVNDATGGDGEVARFAYANAASKETLLGFTYRADGSTNPPVEIGYRVDSDGWTGVSKGSLVFKTRSVTTDTAPSEIMRISSAGNVGIGTTSPSNYKLVIGGTGVGSGFSAGISLNGGQSGGSYDGIGYNFRNTATSNLYNYNVADTSSRLEFTSGGFMFKTAPSGTAGSAITYSNAMTILQGGNVGIGTTTPVYKLDVVGDVGWTGTLYNGSIPADRITSGELNEARVRKLDSADTRSTNPDPQAYTSSVQADFKTNTVDGLADGGTYHGVISYRTYGSTADYSGGPMHQLGFTENGNIWARKSTGSTTWGSWYQIARDEMTNSFSFMGNVGIGTTSPDGKLTIDFADYVYGIHFVRGATNLFGFHANSGIPSIETGASGKLYINGNVGIGTTSPNVKLQVSGQIYQDSAGTKMIFKSPDGTCSACGPDNSDVWTCASVTCP
jgi:hypothetical protein